VIRNITIEHYKGFKKINVNGLTPFTLIGGKNDVGKSSFLEAIFLFFDRQNPSALLSHFGWRNVGVVDATPDSVWDSAFYKMDTTHPISISTTDQNGTSSVVSYRFVPDHNAQQNFQPFQVSKPEGTTLQTQATGQAAVAVRAKQGAHVLQDTYVSVGIGGITSNGTVHRHETRQAIYLSSSRIADAGAPARLSSLIAQKKLPQVIEAARLVDPRLRSLAVGARVNGTSYLMAEVDGMPNFVPLSLLGAGIGIVVNIALAVASVPNGTVLIDELEIGIHHSALPNVLEAISRVAFSNKTQIIATTHSYEFIKSAFSVFNAKNPDRFTYFRLERNKEEDVTAKIYPSEALEFAMTSEWEVR